MPRASLRSPARRDMRAGSACPVAGDGLIPKIQLRGIAAALAKRLQQGIALGQCLGIFAQAAGVTRYGLGQRQVQIAPAFLRSAFDDLGHLRHKNDRIEMPDDISQWAFDPIQQDFLAQALTGERTHRFEHQADLQPVLCWSHAYTRPPAVPLPGFLAQHSEVDQLPVGMGLERGESRQEIDRLQHAGLALGIAAGQQNNPPGNVHVQAGETAEIGQGEMGQIHFLHDHVYQHYPALVHPGSGFQTLVARSVKTTPSR